jgi:DNA-binding transcriptional regulator GbsR (MarR family)
VRVTAAEPDGDGLADLLRYVERFALVMRESGMPPMPARVFAYVLATDPDRHTAADLAEGLRASPAAISGAVRYLVQVGLLARDRKPGTHGGVYYLPNDDIWYYMYSTQLERLRRYRDVAEEGIAIVGADTAAGRRLRMTSEFFDFLNREYPAVMERWRTRDS